MCSTKNYLFVALVCIVVQLSSQQETTTTAATTTTSATTTTAKPVKKCEKSGLTCLDCRTIQVCVKAGDEEPIMNITCSDQTNKARTYCDASTNECVVDNTCAATNDPESLVACSQDGLRPEPNDCRKYIQCVKSTTAASGFIGYVIDCPEGLRYSQSLQRCVSTLSCPTMKQYCRGKGRRLVSYKAFPSIYGLCPGNTQYAIVTSLCKGQYNFVESVGSCQPVCKSAGTIASNENCQQYYTCEPVLFGFAMRLNTCPTGFGFNAETGVCDETLANCVAIGTKYQAGLNEELIYDELNTA